MTRSFPLPEPDPVEVQTGTTFASLVSLMQRLLAPDGCPWDREQTPQSLCRYVLEEAYEVIDAIEDGDPTLVCEELGDLALQIAFMSELYRVRRDFGPDDVMRGICEKLVRRHPHVFGEESADTKEAVETTWEAIKREEKRDRPLLSGVPRSFPALRRAHQSGSKAARVGFDWPNAEGARRKVTEEFEELEERLATGDPEGVEEEFGDLLFAMTNWGRHLGVEAEGALLAACDKFRERFDEVERRVRANRGDWPRDERGKPTRGVPLEELDAHWDAAKAAKKGG